MASLLDQVLDDAMRSVPECLAAGYIDITSGILLNARTAAAHPQEVFDLVSAATVGLFRDKNLRAIDNWFQEGGGAEEDADFCQEIIIVSDDLLYVFARCRANSDHVAVFVTAKSENVGLVIAKSRMAVNALDCAA